MIKIVEEERSGAFRSVLVTVEFSLSAEECGLAIFGLTIY
tara:strand:- start:167 stop:286 length:120 start_codon:yes stop_codon:yes gene_type:complete